MGRKESGSTVGKSEVLTFPKRRKEKRVTPDPGNDGQKSKSNKEAKKKKAKPNTFQDQSAR